MYSDDMIVLCMTQNLQENMRTTKELCEGLLGPAAVESSKSPDNIDKIQYKDDSENCFKFKQTQVNCPSDDKELHKVSIQ